MSKLNKPLKIGTTGSIKATCSRPGRLRLSFEDGSIPMRNIPFPSPPLFLQNGQSRDIDIGGESKNRAAIITEKFSIKLGFTIRHQHQCGDELPHRGTPAASQACSGSKTILSTPGRI